MKSQSLVILSLCSLISLASIAEAGVFGRRQSYSNNRTTYTYRPTTSASAAKPAAPATKPANTEAVSTEDSDKVAAKTVSAAKPETPTFHPTILSMLARNNATRTARGMRPMLLSARLTAAAQNHANYMARTGSFSHYSNGSPQGRVAAHGFRGGVRENIAMGQPSVEGAFNTWTASGAHYANMMSHSDVAGFGYALGSNGQAYWVAVYGNNDGGN